MENRYQLDIRKGCAAVRDTWHPSYRRTESLHEDLEDVIEYRCGKTSGSEWTMQEEDLEYLRNLCDRINK